jgi:hypothetical protein
MSGCGGCGFGRATAAATRSGGRNCCSCCCWGWQMCATGAGRAMGSEYRSFERQCHIMCTMMAPAAGGQTAPGPQAPQAATHLQD